MQYLIVKNWRDHQHYKKRSPPWIKLHRAVIEDYSFSTLKDKTKAHLILIWVLAAGTEGRIPNDPKFIANKISAAEPVDLEAMIAAGFLIADGEQEQPQEPRLNGKKHALVVDTGEVIERLPLNTGEEFEVRASYAAELKRLYPIVDVPQTLREIRGWCIANPAKLKTVSGIRRCINTWMRKEQNGG